MLKNRVRSEGQALAYIVDCTLATVEKMAGLKGRSPTEFDRQISIAQHGIDWMVKYGVVMTTTRAADVMKETNGSVAEWIKPRTVSKKG